MKSLARRRKADGTFPKAQVEVLKKLGAWMRLNKEALHGVECRIPCSAGTLRFTQKDGRLYVFALERPSAPLVVPGVTPLPGSAIKMLGSEDALAWRQEGADLVVEELPNPLPCDSAWVFKTQIEED